MRYVNTLITCCLIGMAMSFIPIYIHAQSPVIKSTTRAASNRSSSETIGTFSGFPAKQETPISSVAAAVGLQQYYSATGNYTLSADGKGSLATSMRIRVNKPNIQATVKKAVLISAVTGSTITNGCVTLAGVPITWEGSASVSFFNNYWADVTNIVASRVNSLPAGIDSSLIITECNSSSIDGEALLVIFDDPAATEKTIIIMCGAANPAGDNFSVTLSKPIDPSLPSSLFDMGLGIGYSYQSNGTNQASTVTVNNQRLTSSAGGEDDGAGADGALLTVGGIGDVNTNPPNPTALPTNPRSDDELYTIKPFINNQTTSLNINTINPSLDDNIFLAYFTVSGAAIVGEGILISQTDSSGNVGTNHTVKASVLDSTGKPVVNRQVSFTVKFGPNAGRTFSTTTNASGDAFFTYTGTGGVGTDTIQASFTNSRGNVSSSNILFFKWLAVKCANNIPPVFISSVPCGATIQASVGKPVSFTVAASDANTGDIITLNGNGLPVGAVLTPTLPAKGNPVQSIFSWMPAAADVGSHTISFNANDSCTQVSCSYTIIVQSDTTKIDTTNHNTCPKSDTIIANPVTCKAKVTWTVPSAMYPDTIPVVKGVNLNTASLIYKGTFNGHGYYESNDQYNWTAAIQASRSVASHLISITSAAENNFVKTNINERFNYAWIGLRNTGTVGSFVWVTGEPLGFTDWIPGEPDNLWHDPSFVHEPFGHINGFDSLSRWNDISGDVNMKFIAEYDSAVITRRQISGPTNGDSLSAGVYTICYENTNRATGKKDTCCFNITVLCNSITSGCPKDTTFIANRVTCKAKVTWTVPSAMFPDSVNLGGPAASLIYRGTLNGHGYYESNFKATWPNARLAVSLISGHLITITSAAENNFVNTNFNERNNYAWIGLYNTGTVGSFAWVTGEPLGYTNWIPGEPDNLWHDPSFVHEPYVHINGYDSLRRWNDIGPDIQAQFLAEFDSSIIRYRQISGPTNGDSLSAGVYTICYERTNRVTSKRDTCCFNITVVCNSLIVDAEGVRNGNERIAEAGRHTFNAVAYPNPSNASFSVKLNTDNLTEKVGLKVVDVAGRIIEIRNSIAPGNTLTFGSSYVPGTYFTTITQGSKTIIMKLVKQ